MSSKPQPQAFRTSADREIASWASTVNYDNSNITRQICQLNDNVTENRMLLSKVQELSKERVKFMMQSNYDRKVFLETQQRKARFLKGLLRGIDVTTYLRNIGMGVSSMNNTEHIKKQYAGKMLLIREMIAQKQGETRPQTTITCRHMLDGDYSDDEDDNDEAGDDDSVANYQRTKKRLSSSIDTVRFPKLDSIAGGFMGLSIRESMDEQKHEDEPPPRESALLKSRARMLKMRPLKDPRYCSLERSLCSTYLPPKEGPNRSVVHIIQKIDTLHRPHKRTEISFQPSTTKRLNPRIKAYMEERGIFSRPQTSIN